MVARWPQLLSTNILLYNLEPGSPTLYRIKSKKGESLENLDYVLDMVGCGLE